MNSTLDISPLGLAIEIARNENDVIGKSMMLHDIVREVASGGRFPAAFVMCREIQLNEFRLKALLHICRKACNQGQLSVTTEIIGEIVAACRQEHTDFLFDEFLPCLHEFPGMIDIPELLAMAQEQAQQVKHGGRKLASLVATIAAFAAHCPDQAEALIDCLFELPLARMEMGDGHYHDGRYCLCDIALIIEKHGLDWSEHRRKQFLRHFNHTAEHSCEGREP